MTVSALGHSLNDLAQKSPAELAEMAALGIVLSVPDRAADVFARVPVAEFTGQCLPVAEAIQGLRVLQKPVDVWTVMAELERRGTLQRAGGLAFLDTLTGSFTTPVMLLAYVEQIVKEVRRRKVWQASADAVGQAGNRELDPVTVARTAAERLTRIVDAADTDSDEVPIPTLREFLDVDDEPFDWAVPGLLERGDRLILTGSEGLGKSMLMRQLYVASAFGIHPLNGTPMPPVDVLVIDCENGERKVRRSLRGLVAQARRQGTGDDSHLKVICRPEGLDLTDPADAAWFLRTVSDEQPGLLVTGPIYRLHAQDANEEKPAREVARVLDRARAAANCAVVLEAHSPHGGTGQGPRPVRPVGSSLWLRWPEFGYGLRPTKDFTPETRVVDFVPWRGDREERDWPQRLKAGGTWPWAKATFDEHNSWGS